MRSQRSQTARLLFVILMLILAIWLVYTYFLRPESVPVPAEDQSQSSIVLRLPSVLLLSGAAIK